uniref:Uncharacterized protein n=1 Tax=Picea sitchensis TaxID=3332 RepID=A0A6B9XS89_PICSI|nr:hypothetical protein Q903MT_gene6896 [Picea sitchensis]
MAGMKGMLSLFPIHWISQFCWRNAWRSCAPHTSSSYLDPSLTLSGWGISRI